MPATDQRHAVLLACMPKSGSTYLRQIFTELPGFTGATLVPGYGRREQELSRELLVERTARPGNFIAQIHLRYSSVTADYIAEFGLKPVVLVRDVFDVTVSLIDFLRGAPVNPVAVVPREFAGWDDDQAAEFITAMYIPWYFNFFLTWQLCDDKTLVTYEDLVADPVATVGRICDSLGIDVAAGDVAGAVNSPALVGRTRLNQGVTGRGESLPETCKRRIRSMAAFYAGRDLSPIGL
jgi:Sulfotransferase domain